MSKKPVGLKIFDLNYRTHDIESSYSYIIDNEEERGREKERKRERKRKKEREGNKERKSKKVRKMSKKD